MDFFALLENYHFLETMYCNFMIAVISHTPSHISVDPMLEFWCQSDDSFGTGMVEKFLVGLSETDFGDFMKR
jgi:hypothetical protein